MAELVGRIGRGEMLCQSTAWLCQGEVGNELAFRPALERLLLGEGASSLVAGGGFWPEPFVHDPRRARASLFWGRKPDGSLKFYDDYNDPAGPGYHGEEWYVPLRHMTVGKAYWSRSYMDPYSLQPMVTCSFPLFAGGAFLGVQTVDLRLEGLRAFLEQASRTHQGYAFVLDRNGTFVTFPDERKVQDIQRDAQGQELRRFLDIEAFAQRVPAYLPVAEAVVSSRQELLRSSAMDEALARRLDAESPQIGPEEARRIAVQIVRGPETQKDDVRRTARLRLTADPILQGPSWVSVYRMPGTFWDVVVVTPQEAATREALRLSRVLLTSLLLALLLPLGAAYLLIRRYVVVPLRHMRAALEVGRTPDGLELPLVEASRPDELGLLADRYNQRTDQLATAMATLVKREHEYRVLFEQMQDLFYRTDLAGKLVLVSPSVEVLLGYTPQEALGMDLAESVYVAPEARDELLMRIQREGVVRDFETRLRRKDGRIIWVSSNSHAYLDADGVPTGVEGTVRDITARKAAELAIDTMRRYLKQILDAMPSVLIATDAEGRVQEWNHAAEIMMLRDHASARGQCFWEAAPELQRYQDDFREVLATRLPRRHMREPQPGLTTRFCDTTLYPLEMHGVWGVVIRMDDATELEVKDRQLRQIQKMETLGVLAGGLAHDFNNVLSAITGTLSILQFAMEEGEVSKEELNLNLGVMGQATQRAADIVQQLLTLSRQQELTLRPTDLNQSVARVAKLCRGSLDKSVALELFPHEEAALTMGDPGQIEQVLLNLCVNGAHAMTIMRPVGALPGGTLTLSIRKLHADPIFCTGHPEACETDYWVVSVRDTGVGLDTKTAAKVFDPFFTTKEKGQGTGLGLAMVYSIVKAHGGFIDLYSELGHGATFTVYLPVLLDPGRVEGKTHERKALPRGSGRILVVEDEATLRTIARTILQACGYEVVESEDGEEGLRRFTASPDAFRAALIDMAMPRMDGRILCERILRLRPDLPVLLTSGFRKDARVEAALALGAKGFLPKPYTLETLAEAMAHMLQGT